MFNVLLDSLNLVYLRSEENQAENEAACFEATILPTDPLILKELRNIFKNLQVQLPRFFRFDQHGGQINCADCFASLIILLAYILFSSPSNWPDTMLCANEPLPFHQQRGRLFLFNMIITEVDLAHSKRVCSLKLPPQTENMHL